MPIVNIPKGTPDWDIPINQNFETLQNEKVGLDSNGKIDKTLLPDDIGGGLENFQEKHTYAELAALIAENKLIPGMQYVLMDYQTKYIQPTTEVLKIMSIERLVLTAIDESHFAPECSSLSYPQDIVTYDFNMNKCEDNTTPRNGFITWRKSTNTTGSYAQISAPQDWRTMLWVRYKPDPDYYMVGSTKTQIKTWTSGAVTAGELYKKGNSIYLAFETGTPSDMDDLTYTTQICNINESFLLNDVVIYRYNKKNISLIKSDNFSELYSFRSSTCSNITFIDSGKYYGLHNNTFGYQTANVTLNADCTKNFFGDDCRNNTLGTNCTNNLFISQCRSNTLHSNCSNNCFVRVLSDNILYPDVKYNIFHEGAGSNILMNRSSNNFFTVLCTTNQIGSCCTGNIFMKYASNNVLGNQCTDFVFGESSSCNKLGNNCRTGNFGKRSSYNVLLSNVNATTFGEWCQYNTIFPDASWNTFGDRFSRLKVKQLNDKDVSNISALSSDTFALSSIPYTIEKGASGKYYYWCLNSSGQMQSTLIP